MSEPSSPDARDEKTERDPLDELLRGTMRALEAQTPAGTFEALPQAVDAAIEAGAGVGDEDVELAAEAGGRARRGSSQGPELGGRGGRGGRDSRERRARRSSAGELRKTPSTVTPPIAAAGPLAAPVRESSRRRPPSSGPSDSRAYRRSLLQTQVGAPQRWWQTRAAALAVLGVAVAAAVALIVLRRGDGDASEQRLGASSSRLRQLPRPAVRVSPPPDAAPALTAEQGELRRRLSEALPAARACVGARPLDEVELSVTLEASGAVAAVAIRGAPAAMAAEACITKAVRDAAASGAASDAIGAGAARTITIPLFE